MFLILLPITTGEGSFYVMNLFIYSLFVLISYLPYLTMRQAKDYTISTCFIPSYFSIIIIGLITVVLMNFDDLTLEYYLAISAIMAPNIILQYLIFLREKNKLAQQKA